MKINEKYNNSILFFCIIMFYRLSFSLARSYTSYVRSLILLKQKIYNFCSSLKPNCSMHLLIAKYYNYIIVFHLNILLPS